jgi:glycosyltransferase involved in cell wall biosynthesis
MALISVIIPFYSTTKGLLKNAVHSALSQSNKDIEVIVIDDFSPVKATIELADIIDSRLSIVNHTKNSNGGIARNTGIVNANGEYVAFLDYDDIWYPDKLDKQLELFNEKAQRTENPNQLVVYSRCKIIDGQREFIRPIRPILENETVGEYLFCAKQIIQTSGIFLKRATAESVRFDDLKRHQDYQFCLSLEAQGCVFYMLEETSYEFIQIPKLNDYTFSIKWLSKYQTFLNLRAIKGFKSLVLIRSMVSHGHINKAFVYSWQHKLSLTCVAICSVKLIKKTITLIGSIKK